MENVVFARFPSRALAAKFMHDIQAQGLGAKVQVKVFTPEAVKSAQSLPLAFSNIRSAVMKGLLGGGLGGVVLGLIFAVTGIAPSLGGAVLIGICLGALAGVLGAALIGSSDPDANLEKTLERKDPGSIVLSLRSVDLETEAELRQGVKAAGAEEIMPAGPHPLDGMAKAD